MAGGMRRGPACAEKLYMAAMLRTRQSSGSVKARMPKPRQLPGSGVAQAASQLPAEVTLGHCWGLPAPSARLLRCNGPHATAGHLPQVPSQAGQSRGKLQHMEAGCSHLQSRCWHCTRLD